MLSTACPNGIITARRVRNQGGSACKTDFLCTQLPDVTDKLTILAKRSLIIVLEYFKSLVRQEYKP